MSSTSAFAKATSLRNILALLLCSFTFLTFLRAARAQQLPSDQRCCPAIPTSCSESQPPACIATPKAPAAKVKERVQTSISIGAFPQLTPTRIQGGANFLQTQGIAPTPGILGTVRQQFRPWLGYSVNMGFTRVNERYTNTTGVNGGKLNDYGVHSNFYELSLSYVAQKRLSPRLTGFTDLGAGAVTILPIESSTFSPIYLLNFLPVNFRPEGVIGVGVDLRLTRPLAMRVEYRGLLYKDPDFGLNLQRSTTLTSEPTLSLVYRFGGGASRKLVSKQ